MSPFTAPLIAPQTTGPVTDPFAADIVFYMPADGIATDPFVDTATSKTIVEFGDPAVDISTKYYGTGSARLTPNNYLGVTTTLSDFAFGTGDFTVEAWVNVRAFHFSNPFLGYHLFSAYDSATTGTAYLVAIVGADYSVAGERKRWVIKTDGNTNYLIPGQSEIPIDTWRHMAYVRKNGYVNLFQDGVPLIPNTGFPAEISNQALSTDFAAITEFKIGTLIAGSSTDTKRQINANIDSFRVTRAARYTAAFNPNTDTFLP